MRRRTVVLILIGILAVVGLNVGRLVAFRGSEPLVPGTLVSVSGPTVPGEGSVLRFEPGAEVVFRFDLYNTGRWPLTVTGIRPARGGFERAAALDCGGNIPVECRPLLRSRLGARERRLFHVVATFGPCDGREPGEVVPTGTFLVDLHLAGVPIRQAVEVDRTAFVVPDPCG